MFSSHSNEWFHLFLAVPVCAVRVVVVEVVLLLLLLLQPDER